MTHSESYFGKKLEQLEYIDVENFFSVERVESDKIEFKSINPTGDIDKKINGFIPSIVAFLNSKGGILIWGAPKGKPKVNSKEKVFIGELTPINQKNRERLVNQ